MKKSFLLYPVVVIAVLVAILYTSCKKPHHDLAPTPNNIRLKSYTATTRLNSASLADTTNDNYTFMYDANGRVSMITFTTNDTVGGKKSESCSFYYGNDTSIKTITNLGGSTVFEIDTLIYDLSANVINAIFTPGLYTTYEYTYSPSAAEGNNGRLMSAETDNYFNNYHGVTTVSDSRTYTSYAGNFLKSSFNGILNVTFPSTMTVSPYAMRDYWLQIPGLAITPPNLNDLTVANLPGTIHSGLTGYSDQLTYNISGIPLLIYAKDTANDTCYVDFPGTVWPTQDYTFYSNLANRTGDYLQLKSFTLWGSNLYQNANLVKTITNSGYTTNVSYNIDAYNKITQMTAVIVDSLANTKTVTYNLQYEIY